MKQIAHIVVYGNPRAQGSKRGHAIYKDGQPVKTKDGRVVVVQREMAKGLDSWRNSIAQRTAEQMSGPVVDGPVRVDLVFMIVRPANHYGTGKNAEVLKDSAPLYVEKSPDLDKLVRGVMDGLKGALYTDDKFFFVGRVEKVWVERTERAGVTIDAYVPAVRTVGDLRAKQQAEREPTLAVVA